MVFADSEIYDEHLLSFWEFGVLMIVVDCASRVPYVTILHSLHHLGLSLKRVSQGRKTVHGFLYFTAGKRSRPLTLPVGGRTLKV